MALAKYVTRSITTQEVVIYENGKEVFRDATIDPVGALSLYKKISGKQNLTSEVKEVTQNRRMLTTDFIANSEVFEKTTKEDNNT